MLRYIVKSCLVAAMAVAMAAPVMAVEAKVSGRTRTWLEQAAVKDSTTTMQFKADGRLAASISGKAGDYTVTAFQDFNIDSDANATSPTIRFQKVTLDNDSFGVSLGYFSPYGVTRGMKYAPDVIANAYWVGENLMTTDVADHLTVDLKSAGLTAILAMNNYKNSDGTTKDARNETILGAIYSGQFGPVDLGVEVLSGSAKIDEKDSQALKSGQYDGQSFNAVALGVGYGISETMGIALNYESNSKQSGVSGSTAEKNSIMELWFDLGLGNETGISVGYGMKDYDNGSPNKTKSTMTNLTYAKTMGMATIFASYNGTTEKDDDTSTDTATTTVGAGVVVVF